MIEPIARFTAEQFLAWDETQAQRCQLVWGEAFSMAGATAAHGTIVANLTVALRPGLRGGPCRFFATDMKLAVDATSRRITYPDAFVSCDPRDRADRLVQRHPKLIVEVLSSSTAADDRGDKFAAYRTIDTLEDYALVDGRRRHVELFRKTERGTWELTHDVDDGTVTFASLGATVALDDLYADADLEREIAREI